MIDLALIVGCIIFLGFAFSMPVSVKGFEP